MINVVLYLCGTKSFETLYGLRLIDVCQAIKILLLLYATLIFSNSNTSTYSVSTYKYKKCKYRNNKCSVKNEDIYIYIYIYIHTNKIVGMTVISLIYIIV